MGPIKIETLHNAEQISAQIEAAKEEKCAPIKDLLEKIILLVENNDYLIKDQGDQILITKLKEGLNALIIMINRENIRKMKIELHGLLSTVQPSQVRQEILGLLSASPHFRYEWVYKASMEKPSSKKAKDGSAMKENFYSLEIQWHANPAMAQS